MTIFFVSSHDEQTLANLVIAQAIANDGDVKVFDVNATRAGLFQALDEHPEDKIIFSMSHGSKLAVIDNNWSPALHRGDGARVAGYKIFAWACLTGATVGYDLAQTGTTWWGYECAVNAPDDRPEFAPIHAEVIAEAKARFIAGVDVETVKQILHDIKVRCQDAIRALDAAGAMEANGFATLYFFCNQFWQRLSVWLPGAQEPLRHPDAPIAYYEI